VPAQQVQGPEFKLQNYKKRTEKQLACLLYLANMNKDAVNSYMGCYVSLHFHFFSSMADTLEESFWIVGKVCLTSQSTVQPCSTEPLTFCSPTSNV
jgi:hypothetical protein